MTETGLEDFQRPAEPRSVRNSLSHHGSALSRVLEAGLPDRPPIVGSLERLVAAGTVN